MVTKTARTVQQYLNRAALLHNAAFKEFSEQYPNMYVGRTGLDPLQIAVWLDKNKKAGLYSKSTFRTYKCSLVCYTERLPDETPNKYEALDFLKESLNDGTRKVRINNKTSARKVKGINEKDLSTLTTWLTQNKGKWYQLSADWLRASVLTGLRPSEWPGSELIEYPLETEVRVDMGKIIEVPLTYTLALRVPNGKNSNGRANGDYRTLILAHLSKKELKVIMDFLLEIHDICVRQKVPFAKVQENCRLAIYYANKRAFPRRKHSFSLYSARHQFAANMKASGKSKVEVAALMGHAEAATATKHYARENVGSNIAGIIVDDHEVSSVRTVSLEKQEIRFTNFQGLNGSDLIKLKN
jgi:integrase